MSAADAQTESTKSTSCHSSSASQIITQAVAAVPGQILNTFICVGDLDGTGKQVIVVGHQKMEANGTVSGKTVIITNKGAIRETINY